MQNSMLAKQIKYCALLLFFGTMIPATSACDVDELKELTKIKPPTDPVDPTPPNPTLPYEKSANAACTYLIPHSGLNDFEFPIVSDELSADSLKKAQNICIEELDNIPFCHDEYIALYSCELAIDLGILKPYDYNGNLENCKDEYIESCNASNNTIDKCELPNTSFERFKTCKEICKNYATSDEIISCLETYDCDMVDGHPISKFLQYYFSSCIIYQCRRKQSHENEDLFTCLQKLNCSEINDTVKDPEEEAERDYLSSHFKTCINEICEQQVNESCKNEQDAEKCKTEIFTSCMNDRKSECKSDCCTDLVSECEYDAWISFYPCWQQDGDLDDCVHSLNKYQRNEMSQYKERYNTRYSNEL